MHIDGVLKRPRHHIRTTAHHRLQSPRATRKIRDRDIQTLCLEVAQLLGNRQRQVVKQVFTAHGNAELRLFQRLAPHQGRENSTGHRGGDKLASLHGFVSCVDQRGLIQPLAFNHDSTAGGAGCPFFQGQGLSSRQERGHLRCALATRNAV